MKLWAGLLLVFFTNFLQAQKPLANFDAIDWYVQSIKETNIDSLAAKLTAPYNTELEKVRAIYSWICQNIQYNADIYRPLALRAKYIPEPIDTTSEWRSADEMVAQKVLRRGKGVCDGYSRLFKVLCQYAGIEAVVLNGYVRSDFDRAIYRFRTNHTWNAVRIDSVWHLVDATWAAGYMTYSDEFVQKQNDYYFLTPPEDLIRDHYPEDLRWSLLSNPPTLAEFRKMPFRSKSYLKYGIASYSPSNGIVEAEVGDTLTFTISVKDAKKAKTIFPDPFLDTASFALSPASVFIKPQKEVGDTAYYQFVVDDATQWVHLLFNDDVILRYSVNHKQTLARK
jgi:transglutaminase/protease-like cytokinesis protein 3